MTNTKEQHQSIIMVLSKPFYKVMCDFYKDQKKEFYMTRQQIGQALEYKDPQKAIDNIHVKHESRLSQFSTTLNLRGVELVFFSGYQFGRN